MSTTKKLLTVAALAAALTFGSRAAHADGIATAPAALPTAARTALAKDIAAYKTAHPEMFSAVRSVDSYRPEVYKKAQNPIPQAERELRRLGPAALLPMLDALAFDAIARDGATDTEWRALTVGLLEAVGVLRDARSSAVSAAVFEAHADPAVAASAARVLGRLGGDAETSILVKHAVAGDKLVDAAVAGLGECRRIEAVKALAALLAGDESRAETVAKALGQLGSSWAWKALGPSAAAKGMQVREAAARVLVPLLGRTTGEARAQVHRSILLVEHPVSLELIAKAKLTAPADVRPDLERLEARLTKQLAH